MTSSGKPASSRERHFATDHLDTELGERTARGGVVVVAAQALRLVVVLGSSMVLARLLGPEAYGLAGMVTVVSGLLLVFNEVGLSLATIQKQRLEHAEVSAVFWLQLLVSFVLMLIALALAPGLAWFYGEPRVAAIGYALAGSFVLIGLASQHQALLRRQMRFGLLAAMDVGSVAVAALAAIVAAAHGWDYWALVVQQLVQHAVVVPVVWLACGWRPGRPRLEVNIRDHIDFSKHFAGYKLLDYLAKGADRVLFGWYAGERVLGLYTRAYTLLVLPFGQITMPVSFVLLPALSRLQNEPERFKRLLLRAVAAIGWLALPLSGFFVVCAPDVVWLLLGDKWTEATPLVRYFGIGAVAMPFMVTLNWILLPLGRTDRMLRWGVISSIGTLALVAAAVRYGAEALAIVRALVAVATFLGGTAYASLATNLRLRDVLRSLRWQLAAAVVGGAVGLVSMGRLFASDQHVVRLLWGGGLVLAFQALALYLSGDLARGVSGLKEWARKRQNARIAERATL